MILENIDKLEELVGSLVEETRRLRAEKAELTQDKQSLEKQVAAANNKIQELEAKMQRLAQLENATKKYEAEQDTIRNKVQNILDQLEKLEIG